ncbi:hypothetical protein V6N13_105979 [Hibiscus sabdariffa]|uniref:Uncharacterized protein n=1 Tax=Hibiscus sabdariffa TaxID=183260 RepID=A0ABR2EZC4_9ROSI
MSRILSRTFLYLLPSPTKPPMPQHTSAPESTGRRPQKLTSSRLIFLGLRKNKSKWRLRKTGHFKSAERGILRMNTRMILGIGLNAAA